MHRNHLSFWQSLFLNVDGGRRNGRRISNTEQKFFFFFLIFSGILWKNGFLQSRYLPRIKIYLFVSVLRWLCAFGASEYVCLFGRRRYPTH